MNFNQQYYLLPQAQPQLPLQAQPQPVLTQADYTQYRYAAANNTGAELYDYYGGGGGYLAQQLLLLLLLIQQPAYYVPQVLPLPVGISASNSVNSGMTSYQQMMLQQQFQQLQQLQLQLQMQLPLQPVNGSLGLLLPLPTPAPLIEKLAQVLPRPPLALLQVRPQSLAQSQPKRLRRRSKYTKEQDDMIVKLKKLGKSWVLILDITGVGSFLLLRNRYQVLIGQQGGGTSECDLEDLLLLHSLLDDGEIEKWRYLSKEFHKSTGKSFSDRELQDIVRQLFWTNPELFGITEEYLFQYMKTKSVGPKKGSDYY